MAPKPSKPKAAKKTPRKSVAKKKTVKKKSEKLATNTKPYKEKILPHDQHREKFVVDIATGEQIEDLALDVTDSNYSLPYSHSMIQSIAKCTAQAFFNKSDAPERKVMSLARGVVAHSLLELMGKERIDPTTLFEKLWKEEMEDHKKEFNSEDQEAFEKKKRETFVMMKDFFAENEQVFLDRVRPEDCEVEFNTVLELNVGDKKIYRNFTGKIDLILWNKDRTKYRIWDYKTSASAPADETVDRNVQFAIYQKAMTEKFGFPPEEMVFYFLKGTLIKGAKKATNIETRDLNNYNFIIPIQLHSKESLQRMLDLYYLPNILKWESGIVGKDGLAQDFDRCCKYCKHQEHCDTVKSLPLPNFIRLI